MDSTMIKSANRATVADHQTLRCVGHCLYRSKESDVYYAILKRAGKQIKRSLKTEGNFDNQAKIKNCHEYVLAYSRNFEKFPPHL